MDCLNTVKLADKVLTCLDGLLQVTVRQSSPTLGRQGMRRRHDIFDLKVVSGQRDEALQLANVLDDH
jgi:hypothetical protein